MENHTNRPVKKTSRHLHIKKQTTTKDPDKLEWKAEHIVTSTDNSLIFLASLKIPLYFRNLYYRNRHSILTDAQRTFLEKFKKEELPCILTPSEKEIFDSLSSYHFLFTEEESSDGWKIDKNPYTRGTHKLITWP